MPIAFLHTDEGVGLSIVFYAAIFVTPLFFSCFVAAADVLELEQPPESVLEKPLKPRRRRRSRVARMAISDIDPVLVPQPTVPLMTASVQQLSYVGKQSDAT